jgi:hypothetical protein
LKSAFAAIGLTIPTTAAEKPVYSEIAREVWWLNVDSRGGLWINGREKKDGETLNEPDSPTGAAPFETVPGAAAPDAVPAPEVAPAVATADEFSNPAASAPAAESPPAPQAEAGVTTVAEIPSTAPSEPAPEPSVPLDPVVAAVRVLLKESKAGSVTGKVDRLADDLGKPVDEVISMLVSAGFRVPEKPREKPVFVEHGSEILWLNRNVKGELWLNAKASKFADRQVEVDEEEVEGDVSEVGEGEGEKKPGRRVARGRTKKAE